MRTRALAVAVALVASSAAAVSAGPNVQPPGGSAAPAGQSPLGFHRDDFRSAATLGAARMRLFAAHARSSRQVAAADSGQQPVWGWGDSDTALPDLDGDGVGEVLSSRLFARPSTVKVLSGRTGRTLWSLPGSTATRGVVYVPAPAGKSVMLLFTEADTGQVTPLGGGEADTFEVSAVNPKTAATEWSTSFTGAFLEAPAVWSVNGVGGFDGVLMRKNATPYLLFDRFSAESGSLPIVTNVVPEVLDATTGNVVVVGPPGGGDSSSYVVATGDLDGDGTDDYVVGASGDVGSMGARSGASGAPLWTTTPSSSAWLIWFETSPDLSGDHKPDLLFGWVDDSGSTVQAVDGASGATVWTAPGDVAEPLGDIDHDGRSDTRVTVDGSPLAVDAISATGKRLWSHAVVSPSGGPGWVQDAGDLDGDHYPDAYVEFAARKSHPLPTSAEIISGRTGAGRTVAVLGWPLGVSLRGGAPSFVRGVAVKNGLALTAYDGRSRRAFWKAVVKTSGSAVIAMLDEVSLGHGHVGLLALLPSTYSETIVLLDGRRGTALWKTTYDTLGPDAAFLIGAGSRVGRPSR